MKIEYQCSNCAKRETTQAMVGIPHGMWGLNYRAVGDALYCPDCVNTWSERNGKSFDDQYKEPWQMFHNWWNRTVKEQADKEGKSLKTYHMTACGDYAEGRTGMNGVTFHDDMIKDAVCNQTIDRVLEIIDAEAWSYCDYVIKHENGNADKQSAACHLSENIRNAVMALKGGDKE